MVLRIHGELLLRHRHWRSVRTIVFSLAPVRIKDARARALARRALADGSVPEDRAREAGQWLARYAHGWLPGV